MESVFLATSVLTRLVGCRVPGRDSSMAQTRDIYISVDQGENKNQFGPSRNHYPFQREIDFRLQNMASIDVIF